MCARSSLLYSFLLTFDVKVTPKVTPRQAQWIPKGTRTPKAIPGTFKTIKKSSRANTWALKGA